MITANYSTSDRSIRTVLINKLNEKYKADPETAIIPEFTLPHASARVDIAVINGVMHGYELKSDIDNLLRLTSQKDAYNLIFDKLTLVVGKNHIVEALSLIPDWWGVTIAKITQKGLEPLLIPIREAHHNPNQDTLAIANILWKEEAISILEDLGESKSLRNMSKAYICHKLIESLNECDLKKYVKRSLINRNFNSRYQAALG